MKTLMIAIMLTALMAGCSSPALKETEEAASETTEEPTTESTTPEEEETGEEEEEPQGVTIIERVEVVAQVPVQAAPAVQPEAPPVQQAVPAVQPEAPPVQQAVPQVDPDSGPTPEQLENRRILAEREATWDGTGPSPWVQGQIDEARERSALPQPQPQLGCHQGGPCDGSAPKNTPEWMIEAQRKQGR